MSKGANAFTGVIGLAMFFGALFSVDLRLGFGALGALLVCIAWADDVNKKNKQS